MALQVIDGTWEEIERRIEHHKAEFAGQFLRVTIQPFPLETKKQASLKIPRSVSRKSRISAMGKYAGILSVDDFLRSKQEEIDLENRGGR